MPMYVTLIQRAHDDPITRPDWDQYWRHALSLGPTKLELLFAIILCFRQDHDVSTSAIVPLPGKGVALNTKVMPPLLQQLILHYLNQA